jgi:hypothetical protein
VLGNAVCGTGATCDAIADYDEAIRLAPNYTAARENCVHRGGSSGAAQGFLRSLPRSQ